VLRRIARLADGLIPLGDPTAALPVLHQYLREAGRDPGTFGLTMRVAAGPGGPAAWVEAARKAQTLGATQLMLSTPPDVQGPAILPRLIEAKRALESELGT
jgi:hypothetical protein